MNPTGPQNAAYAWCLLLGGACFFGRAVTALLIGSPPSTGADILTWIGNANVLIMLSNEALVIGAGLLIMGHNGFQQSFKPLAPMQTTAGSALLFAACIVCLVLGVVQGRFVYPIHGLSLTRPEDAELLVSLYFGGYHLVALMFALATTFWAFAMLKAPNWRVLGYAGFVVAVGSIISSYPDLIGPALVFVLEAALALWWIAVGLMLRRSDEGRNDQGV